MKKLYFLVVALCVFNGLNAQIVNIPDANFKAKLLLSTAGNNIAKNSNGNSIKIDTNNNNEIEVSEVTMIYELNMAYGASSPLGYVYRISDLTGISDFISLRKLNCESNKIATLNVTNLIFLEELNCYNSLVTSLNVSGLNKLLSLNCKSNYLTSLNLKGCTSLMTLLCEFNKLTSLDVSSSINMTGINCSSNSLVTLNLGALSKLNGLDFSSNKLVMVDLKGLISLNSLDCSTNLFQIIDISNLPALGSFTCNNNNLLTAILMQNNGLNAYQMYYNSNINGNPNLRYICVEEARQVIVRSNLLNNFGIMGVEVNSYCSFVPSNPFYVIQGYNRFDINNNGCDALDINFPSFKLKIINNNIARDYISASTGNYYIPIASGVNTVIPIIENPIYFNVSPSTVKITFPTQASPFTQNFCVTANGVHPDLEISLLPLRPAVPGFDAKYKLVYKNKGNTTQTGAVNLTFNDAVLDVIVANPIATNQTTNTLSWNFTALQPFETREITFTMNVNSPMETPAVNNGDILNFTTTITSSATDETPLDNTFTLSQTVVGSYDPNDKTCLEGPVITPALIGQYVHYMIRFENKGTFAATNVVVKDMIDLSKFDITSLIPTDASHSFVTNISIGNKVEFIFENINLPFDDANNDGYIAFKIKTLPTLKVNDTFTNDASIYFDYNFPIVTKLASSTFKTLATSDFEFTNYFKLFPNPVQSVLNISSKEKIEVKSISIYNTLGQLVLVIPNAEKVSKIDVSSLNKGNYFIKINSDKGSSNARFIKE